MNFAAELKSEILRIAKKVNKTELQAIKQASSRYRSQITQLKRQVSELEKRVAKATKSTAIAASKAADKDTDQRRFRADGFATLRKKLGLSAQDMGKLLGVSGQSVYKWEQGIAKPQAKQISAIVAIRGIGKKKAIELLSERQGE